MRLRNFTPHSIDFIVDGEVKLSLPSEGVIRLKTQEEVMGNLYLDEVQIPLMKTVYGEVMDLPPYEEGTILIVSPITVSACPDRDDLYCPYGLIRDSQGNIIGCKGLTR